jgi:GT2 family glycosyltransferase
LIVKEHRSPSHSELPLVSAVFLAHNRRDALRESLRRLTLESAYPADRLEVIVVDNASADGTPTMLREEFPRVKLVETGRNLGAPGWNAGFAVAHGDYVLILDDDAYLEPGGIELAVRAAQQEAASLVSFSVVSSHDMGYRFNDEWNSGLLSYWGCAALVNRATLDALGGYDPNIFVWGNELEFTIRLLDRGHTHLYLPSVVAVHMKEPGPSGGLEKTRRNYRHWSYAAAKLLTPRDAITVLTSLLVRVVLDSLTDDSRTIRAVWDVAAGSVIGLKHRAPVRPVVSHTYREDCWLFASPWRFMRSPRERWQVYRHREGSETQREARRALYFAARSALYPAGRASLKL